LKEKKPTTPLYQEKGIRKVGRYSPSLDVINTTPLECQQKWTAGPNRGDVRKKNIIKKTKRRRWLREEF